MKWIYGPSMLEDMLCEKGQDENPYSPGESMQTHWPVFHRCLNCDFFYKNRVLVCVEHASLNGVLPEPLSDTAEKNY